MKIKFVLSILFVLILSFALFANTTSSVSPTCPKPKDFKAVGSGHVTMCQQNSLLTLFNEDEPQASSAQDLANSAADECSRDLQKKIAKAITNCARYCQAVPNCESSAEPNINSCQGNAETDCTEISMPVSIRLFNPRYGAYPGPITLSFDAWQCDVSQESIVSCTCSPMEVIG